MRLTCAFRACKFMGLLGPLGVLLTGFVPAAYGQRIVSISVCSPTGAGGQGSCPSGTYDTHQIVLAPDGSGQAINTYQAGGAADEHSSVFSPGTLGSNKDYLFFIASGAKESSGIGTVVLSGGSGPAQNGQWTFDIPTVDGYGMYPDGFGQVFRQASSEGRCPNVAGGNAATQDQTFDLNYAAPGSVLIDPTGPAGRLLRIYEGCNACIGNSGGPKAGTGAYISAGVATSLDYGKTWPTYRGTATFTFVPMPDANKTQGPNLTMGAVGSKVCMGNDCSTTPPAAYGRYPVLMPPASIATVMAAGQALGGNMGDSQVSAFLDDVGGSSKPYVYLVHNYLPGGSADSDLAIARAQLSGSDPLVFSKWNGQGFSTPGIGGAEALLLPNGSFQSCGAASQQRTGASIMYVDTTQQYLLLFTCRSPNDPAAGPGTGHLGNAWFYSTSTDLSDPTKWSTPQEITGSWSEIDSSGGCASYKGWYPTLMSMGAKPGHISTTGHVFYLWGCETGSPTGDAPDRQFSSRMFTISTTPGLTSGSVANGATYLPGGLVPGSWAQVKGTGLSGVTRIWGDSDFANLGNKLPTSLSGVQVKVNDIPAAVYYISPIQVNFQVPDGISGTASVQVIYNGQTSNTLTAAAVASSPGIFPVIANGVNYPAAIFYPDGRYVGDPSLGPAFRNAKPGDILQLFATGLVPVPAGVLASLQSLSGVTVKIGNVTFPADFAGLVGAGLFQINFTVPQQFASRPAGAYPITIQVTGVSSPLTINSDPPDQIVLPIEH